MKAIAPPSSESDPAVTAMKIAVAVASIRRSDEIGELLAQLSHQTLQPSQIILSLETPADAPADLPAGVQVIFGPKGLTRQRNRALDAVNQDCDAVVFFDDDYLPCDDAIEGIAKIFAAHRDVAGATGRVLQDGITRGGLLYDDALRCLAGYHAAVADPITLADIDELYGCNMAFRMSAVREIRFDEKLPLYGWQEDVDFAGQLLAKGRIVKTNGFSGVHRGVTRGRTPGLALGFSQIVNPVYLVNKGTMRPAKALKLIARNLVANHLKSVRPEAYIDRAGRVRGNWLGLLHVMSGKSDPGAILRL
jgi:GT2 family glycosyltransferase